MPNPIFQITGHVFNLSKVTRITPHEWRGRTQSYIIFFDTGEFLTNEEMIPRQQFIDALENYWKS